MPVLKNRLLFTDAEAVFTALRVPSLVVVLDYGMKLLWCDNGSRPSLYHYIQEQNYYEQDMILKGEQVAQRPEALFTQSLSPTFACTAIETVALYSRFAICGARLFLLLN